MNAPSIKQCLSFCPQHWASGYDQRLYDLATLTLQIGESLDLPMVLNQVAQQVALLFGGVCQVRFAPAHRPSDARCVIADLNPETRSAAGDRSGAGEPITALLIRLDHAGSQAEADRARADLRIGVGQLGETATQGAALLFAPLIARGRHIGMIDVVIPAPDDVSVRHDQCLLRTVAAQAALAIDTADQFSRLRPPSSANADKLIDDDLSLILPMVAHDLRGPITALRSSIQMLARMASGAYELDRARITRLTELAEAAVGQLERQVDTLSPASPMLPIRPEPSAARVDIIEVAQMMASFYQQTTDKHQITVTSDVADLAGAWVQTHLDRVLSNLLINGIKYSPAGGEIHIHISREEDALGNWATLSVRNHGLGIPAADLLKLAQAGQRASNVGAIPGSGFGLASVREVVEQCGGTLAIQSVVGGCTTVLIRLPLR